MAIEDVHPPEQGGLLAQSPNILPKAAWYIHAEQEVAEAHESGQPLSVLFIDLDSLKDTNDTLGHAEGDHVIAILDEAVQAVQNNFRLRHKPGWGARPLDALTLHAPRNTQMLPATAVGTGNDIEPGRIGGDEFAVLCHTDSSGVDTIIARLRDAFRGGLDERLQAIGVDISIGVSTLMPGMSVAEFLKEAEMRHREDKLSHLRELDLNEIASLRGIGAELSALHISPRRLGWYLQRYGNDRATD